jgi:DNA-binding response OmpR family regulator
MTRMLILGPEASLSTLLQEILEQEGYEMIAAANSYEGLQATHVPLSKGVTLDVQYLIVW